MAGRRDTTIWWPEMCSNVSQKYAFWSDQITVNAVDPDFTLCFQATVLAWVPCFVLWFAAPFYLIYLKVKKYVHTNREYSCLNLWKTIFIIILCGTEIADFIYIAVEHPNFPPAWWIQPWVYLATFILALFLTRYEFLKGIHSSGLMFCFWLLLTTLLIVPFRTKTSPLFDGSKAIDDVFLLVLFCVFFFFTTSTFALHLFSDVGTFTCLARRNEEKTPLLSSQSDIELSSGRNDEKSEKPCPEITAPFWSRISFSWCSRLLRLGYKKQLTGDKLWDLRPQDVTKVLIDVFYKKWLKSSKDKTISKVKNPRQPNQKGGPLKQEQKYELLQSEEDIIKTGTWKVNSSIVMASMRTFGREFSVLAIFEVCNITITFIRPTLLGALIKFVESHDPLVWRGYLYTALLFILTIMRGVIQQQSLLGKFVCGMRVRSALNAAVYRKALLLDNSCRSKYSVGEIVNLMGVDCQRTASATFFLHNLWTSPVNIIVAMVMLGQYLGSASLAGLAMLMCLVLLNLYMASKVRELQTKTMKQKDKRVKQTNEILNGVKVLKLYAWEGAFQDRLKKVRDEELSYIKKAAYYFSGTSISLSCAPVLYTVVTFTIYTLVTGNGGLSAEIAFVSLSLVNNLTVPLTILPNGIANFVQALVSVKRLNRFFNDNELDPDCVQTDSTVADGSVEIKNGTFSWDTGETTVLKDISFKVKPGSFTAIVGKVGAGKSSLLSAILGELYKNEGRVNVQGTFAYVPQESWIRNQTLRDNVLFCKPMKEQMYQKVLEACELSQDLKILPAGDMTEIGEKGINLSGGQKARVSLARGVYANADIYLLDDPLSAVDAHVGKHIFNNVIGPDGMLQNKTRILVTHGLTYLNRVDQIICLKDGEINEIGTYEELLSHNGAFAELIRTYLSNEDVDIDDEDSEEAALLRELRRQISDISESERAKSGTEENSVELRKRKSVGKKTKEQEEAKKEPGGNKGGGGGKVKGRKLIDAESSETGHVNFAVIAKYLKSFGLLWGITIIISFAGQVGFDLFSNIWLTLWSEEVEAFRVNGTIDNSQTDMRIAVYGVIGAAQALSILVQTVVLAIASVKASRTLHENLLDAVIKAPMSFFDTTPIGRVLNRFSSDMSTVDSSIRFTLITICRGCSQLLTTVIAISYATPIFLIAFLPISIAYFFIHRFYVVTSNQLLRLNSTRTSPIYSHFGESITGASSIRAYRLTDEFTKQSDTHIDRMQMARFPTIVATRWLSVWLEVLGAFVVLFCALFAVIDRDSVSGGIVGLSVSYAFQVTNKLAQFVRNTADLENNYVAVERIQEYSRVHSEAPWDIPETKPQIDWPQEGNVVVTDYSTRYRAGLDLVLNKISFSVDPSEKIGIVGRTGAGKSSITLGLFRIIEAAEGNINIDNVITGSIGLHDLRSNLTIIPQDPVLFSGTIRFNIDPFERHTDDELWDALDHAHLKTFVSGLPAQLQHECTEGGGNLSVGQRQLVCLARALLRRTKILILDEATAAVDLATDDLIQTTIRSEFEDCTVVTIAHRINTVLDYDRVMVLDNGQIKEFDNPSTLLANVDSSFYAMCRDAGLVVNGTDGNGNGNGSRNNGQNGQKLEKET